MKQKQKNGKNILCKHESKEIYVSVLSDIVADRQEILPGVKWDITWC